MKFFETKKKNQTQTKCTSKMMSGEKRKEELKRTEGEKKRGKGERETIKTPTMSRRVHDQRKLKSLNSINWIVDIVFFFLVIAACVRCRHRQGRRVAEKAQLRHAVRNARRFIRSPSLRYNATAICSCRFVSLRWCRSAQCIQLAVYDEREEREGSNAIFLYFLALYYILVVFERVE